MNIISIYNSYYLNSMLSSNILEFLFKLNLIIKYNKINKILIKKIFNNISIKEKQLELNIIYIYDYKKNTIFINNKNNIEIKYVLFDILIKLFNSYLKENLTIFRIKKELLFTIENKELFDNKLENNKIIDNSFSDQKNILINIEIQKILLYILKKENNTNFKKLYMKTTNNIFKFIFLNEYIKLKNINKKINIFYLNINRKNKNYELLLETLLIINNKETIELIINNNIIELTMINIKTKVLTSYIY